MIKANVRAAPIANLSDQWERHAGQLIWKEAPRDAFKSVRDCKRWSERHRGKPIDETLGALRVALVENKARRKWQVQVILGARRHALSAHDDQQRAQEDYSLARCLFYPDPAWVEAMGWVRQHTDPADAEADRAIREWICRRAAAQKPRRPRKAAKDRVRLSAERPSRDDGDVGASLGRTRPYRVAGEEL